MIIVIKEKLIISSKKYFRMCFQIIDKIFYVGVLRERRYGKSIVLIIISKIGKKDKSAEYLVSKLSITFHHFFHVFLQTTSEDFFVVVYYLGNNYLTTWLIIICALTV